ncbi:MAG: outer membrane protein assembly factor BamD [Arcobacteraceae bacterium]
MVNAKDILKSGKILLTSGLIAVFLIGCSSKDPEEQEYNKPEIYWYNKMLKQIAFYDLEAADDVFISLESEHRNSPLIPTAMLIIANAHIAEEEYDLAKYYLDEYVKRFGLSNNIDYVRYLKIKANFFAFENQFRNQQLILDTIEDVNVFMQKYPNSPYIHLVEDIRSRIDMAKATFDKEISELYTRKDKPQASELYFNKSQNAWAYLEDVEPVSVPMYRSVFE